MREERSRHFSLPCYSKNERVEIVRYARILALADVYDALHRVNSKSGGRALTAEEIRQKMFELNPDELELITELYSAGIFKF